MHNPFEVLESRMSKIELMLSELTEAYKAQKPPTEEEELMSRKEVAELLKISLATLHARMRGGNIKFHRIGRRVIFYKSEVLGSLKAGEIKGGVHNG